MKKIFVLSICVFMLTITAAKAAETLGDVNGDGKVNLVEAIYALQVVADSYHPTLFSGPNYAIAYAGAYIGIDSRFPVTASFNGDGGLTGYLWETNQDEAPQSGTTQIAMAGSDGTIAWGRWEGGTTAGTYFGNTYEFKFHQAWHYVIGKPSSDESLPGTGLLAYEVIGQTGTSYSGQTLNDLRGPAGGSIVVDFATGKIGAVLTMEWNGVIYTLSTTGGTANTGQSEIALNGTQPGWFFGSGQGLVTADSTCTGGCMGNVHGFLIGDGGRRAGLSIRADIGAGSTLTTTLALKQSNP